MKKGQRLVSVLTLLFVTGFVFCEQAISFFIGFLSRHPWYLF